MTRMVLEPLPSYFLWSVWLPIIKLHLRGSLPEEQRGTGRVGDPDASLRTAATLERGTRAHVSSL